MTKPALIGSFARPRQGAGLENPTTGDHEILHDKRRRSATSPPSATRRVLESLARFTNEKHIEVYRRTAKPSCGPPMHEGERALYGDNDGVDLRAPGAPTRAVDDVKTLSDESDERDLIASVLRKDRKAAARLVAAHIDAVYAYARHRLSPHVDLVDDVVQDVFLAALKGLATFEGQSSLRTWLVAIARHKIEDIYRQRLRAALALDVNSTEDEPASNDIPLDEQIDKARAGAKTRRVLELMPERYALILLWRYWEQRSARDVAAAIGTTEKSVERLLARARAKFKELWLKE